MAGLTELATLMTMDNRGFIKAIDEATNSVDEFSLRSTKSMKKVALAFGTVAAGGLFILAREINKNVDAMGNLYDKTQGIGIAFDKFQGIEFAASKASVSTEKLQNIFAVMQQNIGRAFEGDANPIEGLRQMGLRVEDLRGLKPEEVFYKITDSLKNIGDTSTQAAVGAKIFGKNIKDSLALFNSDVKGTAENFEKLGLAISDTQAAALDEFGEKEELLELIWGNLWKQVAAGSAEAFGAMIDDLLKTIQQWGGMKAVAQAVSDALVGSINKIINAAKRMRDVLREGVKVWAALQGRRAENQITDIGTKRKLEVDAANAYNKIPSIFGYQKRSVIPSIKDEFKLNKLKEQIGVSEGTFNGVDDQYKFEESVRTATVSMKDFAKEIASVTTTAIPKIQDGLIVLATSSDALKGAIEGLKETIDKQKKIQDLLNGDFKDDSKPQAKSEQFDSLGRDLLQMVKDNPDLSQDTIRAQINELKGISASSEFGYDDNGDLTQYSTSDQESRIQKLQDLLLGQGDQQKATVIIEPSAEFFAKIERKGVEAVNIAISQEATATNK